MKGISRDMRFWTLQDDVVLNQASPTPGTKYAVLTTTYCRLIMIMIKITWTVQPSPLELHLIVDGIPMKHSKVDPVSTTPYFPYWDSEFAMVDQTLTDTDHPALYRHPYLEGKNVIIEAEITGGTSNPLECRVKSSRYI